MQNVYLLRLSGRPILLTTRESLVLAGNITDYLISNNVDQNDMTPLHAAAMNGHSDVVEYLIANKAAVTSTNKVCIVFICASVRNCV